MHAGLPRNIFDVTFSKLSDAKHIHIYRHIYVIKIVFNFDHSIQRISKTFHDSIMKAIFNI